VKASDLGQHHRQSCSVLGFSFFVGGLGRRSQKFNRTAATNATSMLFLAVVALVMPAVFDLTFYGNARGAPAAIDDSAWARRSCSSRPTPAASCTRSPRQRDLLPANARPRTTSTPGFTTCSRIGLLAVGTVATTVQAETAGRRAGAGPEAVRVYRAVRRRRGRCHHRQRRRALLRDCRRAPRPDDARGRDIGGSSAQIALFVAPAVILYSFASGRPMSLIFNRFEISLDCAVGPRHLDGRRRRRE
jgi:Ca2+/H+ antiporter